MQTMSKTQVSAEANSHMVVLTREFNAPRELVFKAFTDPKLIAQWWGQDSATTSVAQFEARHGGAWRFSQRTPEGTEYVFRGLIHEIKPSERIVQTFEFEGMPGHIILETISFEERDGKTLVIDSSVFQSVEDRDGMIQAGMADGAEESFVRLDRLLASPIEA
jgi:uncharacterized protein YndB with AHSA1/START domain